MNLSSQLPSSIPAGTEAVLSALPCGWRNRPEHTCIVQTRSLTTSLIKDEFRKPGLPGWGLGVDEREQSPRLLCWIICYSEFFMTFLTFLLWFGSQYLNISSQSWFGFCFLMMQRMQLLCIMRKQRNVNWQRNVGYKVWTVLCLLSSYFDTFYTSLSVMAGIIGRIIPECKFEILGPRLQ